MPLVGVLACLKAESGLNPFAERFGFETLAAQTAMAAQDYSLLQAIITRAWSDVSFGFGQITVASAKGHGYGDGSANVWNVLAVRESQFVRRNSLMVCCEHYMWNLQFVDTMLPGLTGDERLIMGLRVYNGGGYGLTQDYANKYAANLASYRGCLVWAHGVLD